MLDIKRIIQDPEAIRTAMAHRNATVDVDGLIALDVRRKEVVSRHNELRHEQKTTSARFKDKGVPKEEMATLRQAMKKISDEIKDLDKEAGEIEEEIKARLLEIPNVPHESAPVGTTEADNQEIRRFGEPRTFDFPIRDHADIGEALGILDMERGAKISGARFALYKGAGARLERALASFMLDIHTSELGYTEILPPFLVLESAMLGTGQLPKFGEDMFKTQDDQYLIPTAEVPVTNIYGGEILDGATLPLRYAAFSACFRREAGSYGKDTKGLIRLHQFQKVELVKFTTEEQSYEEHESLVRAAETILQRLELPYRVVSLATGDLGFSAAKCYDLEVWLPSQATYREISSCSNFEDFQARRANIRYRPAPGEKPRFVHTLNGSGLAVGRTVAAILENYQQADGTVTVPKALVPYMGGLETISL